MDRNFLKEIGNLLPDEQKDFKMLVGNEDSTIEFNFFGKESSVFVCFDDDPSVDFYVESTDEMYTTEQILSLYKIMNLIENNFKELEIYLIS